MKTTTFIKIATLIIFSLIITSCDNNTHIPEANTSPIRTINLKIAGTLENQLGEHYKSVTGLEITGVINGDDIHTIHQMPELQKLDISEATIVNGGTYNYNNKAVAALENTITEGMFYKLEQIESISLPKSITKIESDAFRECLSLGSIAIPDGVTAIGDNAFDGCTGINSIKLPNSVTTIGNSSFKNCNSLNFIDLPENLTSLGNNALEGCSNIDRVFIPNGITEVKEYTFKGCTDLIYVSIPNSVIKIKSGAFWECTNLIGILIQNGTTEIEDGAFYKCTLLRMLEIPDSVTTIGGESIGTFNGCTYLGYVIIGSGINTIYRNSFDDCIDLREIHINATTPPKVVGENGGITNKSEVTLFVPKGKKEVYQNNSDWQGFKEYIEL